MKRLAIYLMCGRDDAGARRGGGRGRRRPDRARLPVLRPARRRACRACRGGASTGGWHAHEGVPRLPRAHEGARRRSARADDVRLAAGGLRLGTLRDRRSSSRCGLADRRRPAGRRPRRASARAARCADVDRRAHPHRCGTHGRLALPRHGGRARPAHATTFRPRSPVSSSARGRSPTSRCTQASGSRRLRRRGPPRSSPTASSSARRRCWLPTAARRRCAATSRRCDPPWTLRSPSNASPLRRRRHAVPHARRALPRRARGERRRGLGPRADRAELRARRTPARRDGDAGSSAPSPRRRPRACRDRRRPRSLVQRVLGALRPAARAHADAALAGRASRQRRRSRSWRKTTSSRC